MVDVQRPTDPTTTTDPVPAPRSRPLRTAFVALVSAFVVLLGVGYVLLPDGTDVQVSMDEVASAQPFDRDATAQYSLVARQYQLRPKRPKYRETIYGKVEAKGVKVSRVSLRITGAERRTRGQAATIRIAPNRTYRVVLHLKPGKYKVAVRLTVHKRLRTASVTRLLKNKRYYKVRAKVRTSGVVTFLPVTAY